MIPQILLSEKKLSYVGVITAFTADTMIPRGYYILKSCKIQVLGESKKNFFKILYFSSVKLNPFVFEHFYFLLYSGSRCLSLKSPNPTGCGNNPVSGNLRRIRVSSHGLPDPSISPGSQGVGDFFISRYAPLRHLLQKIVYFIGKGLHFSLLSLKH